MANLMRHGILIVVLFFWAVPVVVAEEAIAGQVLTEKDYADFAKKVESTINSGDPSFFDEHYDIDAILDDVTGRYMASDGLKSRFRKDIKERSAKKSVGTNIVASMLKSRCRLLRISRSGDEYRALFRILTADKSFDYFYLQLAQVKSGRVKIGDLYLVSSGHWGRDIIRRHFLMQVYEDKGEIQGSMEGWENDFVNNFAKIKEMYDLGAAGKFKEYSQAYMALPEILRKDKHVLIFRAIFASRYRQDKEYDDAVKIYRKEFPDDPLLDLYLLNTNMTRGPEGFQNAIGQINSCVGGDPYLYMLQAVTFFVEKKIEPAREAVKKAIADDRNQEPELAGAYWVLVDISLDEKKYRETARLLASIEKNLGVIVLGDIAGSPKYSGFLQSQEYRDWLGSRKKN